MILFLGASGGLPPNETTFARVLQKQGYTTGIVGKTIFLVWLVCKRSVLTFCFSFCLGINDYFFILTRKVALGSEL